MRVLGLSFLNEVLLWGALAAAVPVALHLLRRQRYRELPFSGFLFLSREMRKRLEARKLSELLLLALRVLLVILISASLAGPELGGLVLSSGATSLAIVMDQSASMAVRVDGETLFHEARKRAREIVERAASGDRITLVGAASKPVILAMEEQPGGGTVRKILEGMSPLPYGGDLGRGVEEAETILAASKLPNRKLVVLTDGQERVSAEAGKADGEVQAEIVTLSTGSPGNLYVEEVSLPKILAGGPEHRLGVSVANGGLSRVSGSVRVNLDGAYRGERLLSLGPGESVKADFDLSVEPGLHGGFFELTGDDLALDNRRLFLLGVDRRPRIALVGAQSVRRFVELALSADSATDRSELEVRSFHSLAQVLASLGQRDSPEALILCDLGDFDAEKAGKLARIRAAGLGVWVFLGPKTIPSLVNEALARSDILPIRLLGRQKGDWTASMMAKAPGLLPSSKKLARSLEETPFSERQRFISRSGAALTLLSYSDGEPLLMEIPSDPPLFVTGSSADRAFGEMAVSPFFVLMARKISWRLIGDRDLGALDAGTNFLHQEAGQWFFLRNPTNLESGGVTPSGELMPGILVHRSRRKIDQWRAIALPREESILRYPGQTAAPQKGHDQDSSHRGRRSISLPLILFCLALLVAEGLLASHIAQEETNSS